MSHLETFLKRWTEAGLVDAATADRIREFEARHEESTGKLRWPVIVALVFGCTMLGAGVLLFVAAHWDDLSPTQRFTVTLGMVAVFHLAGALLADKFPQLSTGLHGVGTIALGAGIFLAGQIFNLAEHWPGGFLLWAIGALLGWLILRDWVQATLLALLVPIWLSGEWDVRVGDFYHRGYSVFAAGAFLLAVSYLTAVTREERGPVRRALRAIGALGFVPFAIITMFAAHEDAIGRSYWWRGKPPELAMSTWAIGWVVAIGLPLAIAYWLRGRAAVYNALAAAWTIGLVMVSRWHDPEDNPWFYLWALIGSAALVAWGVHEARRERINLGMACFGLTLLGFYFSSFLDKLGRSSALISMGLLFLVGGWFLEKTRRRLVARIAGGGQ
ncbi:MAG: DUF2157 domain-containing protein [Acidobacteriales bacterium]|nr:DUF2157 domain-containing protein [Terriglobales bacterium]